MYYIKNNIELKESFNFQHNLMLHFIRLLIHIFLKIAINIISLI